MTATAARVLAAWRAQANALIAAGHRPRGDEPLLAAGGLVVSPAASSANTAGGR